MPVDTRHRDYLAHQDIWRRIREVLEGQDAIRAAGERYLPRLKGQSAADYASYAARGTFHDATSRTVDGFVGAVFRKAPIIDLPLALRSLAADADGNGTPLAVLAKAALREIVSIGRYGMLVDIAAGGARATAAGYVAEDIVNWREEFLDGRAVLTLVVLRERAERARVDDRYESETRSRYRVLSLEPVPGGGRNYVQTVYERDEDGRSGHGFVTVGAPVVPAQRGRTLDFIPFQFIGADDVSSRICKSPIYGLVNANIAHYQTTVDLKHGAHFTALPTPVIAGSLRGGDQHELKIGSGVAWQLDEGARWGMLEFSGAGLGALRDIREDEKKDMAVLGARLLEDQKQGVEAAAAVVLRHRGENSVLAGISDTVSAGLTRVLDWMAWWSGGQRGTARVTLNKDFFDQAMSASDMVHLVEGWQRGGYGPRVVFENLRGGERLPDDMSFEDWELDRSVRKTSQGGEPGARTRDAPGEGYVARRISNGG